MLQRTNIYLPVQLINFLKTKAKEEKSTMSHLVRKLLDKEVQKENTNWAESLLKLAQSAPKVRGRGLKDLSKRHDYYLYIEPYERKKR